MKKCLPRDFDHPRRSWGSKSTFVIPLGLTCFLALYVPPPLYATTDEAWFKCPYFTVRSDFTEASAPGTTYASLWRYWLQEYRAIQKNPVLRKQLRRRHAHPMEDILSTQTYDGHHRRLPKELVTRQPSTVFTLQLGVYDSLRGVDRFMKYHWPKVSQLAVYARTPKSCYFWAQSEGEQKYEPLFVVKERIGSRKALHVRYGLYATITDAYRDASRLRRHLGWQPQALKRPLTDRLAHAVIFEPVAGRRPRGVGFKALEPLME